MRKERWLKQAIVRNIINSLAVSSLSLLFFTVRVCPLTFKCTTENKKEEDLLVMTFPRLTVGEVSIWTGSIVLHLPPNLDSL